MTESEVECFSGVKTVQNSKKEGGIKRKKKKMKMWNSRKMCLERFYFEKNHKNANPCALAVQLQFFLFSLDTSCLWYSIKYQNWGVPEVICAQRPTTTCMSRHRSRWLLDLSPPPPLPGKQSHKCARTYYESQAITLFRSELLKPAQK